MGKKDTLDIGKMQPQAIELEEIVLGSILFDKEAYYQIAEYFTPELFYKDNNATICSAMLSLKNKNQPIDMMTVVQELKKMGKLDEVGGALYISQLTNRIGSTVNLPAHTQILMQAAIKRDCIKTGTDLIQKSYDDTTDVFDVIDAAEKGVTKLTSRILVSKISTMFSLVAKSFERNKEIISRKGVSGVPSGFNDIDFLTGGWQKSDLIIIAARPAMGKTAYMLNMARNAAVDHGKSVAIFSLEMSELQLFARLQSGETGWSADKYLRIGLNEGEAISNELACKGLFNSKIFIDETPAISIFELKNKARKLKRDNKIDILFVDYMQLMTAGFKTNSPEHEVSQISKALKNLAKELDIPVVALSQLSRAVESRPGKKPQLSDLRDSGSIEQDADLVQFIYRPEYYGITDDDEGNSTVGMAAIITAKHRNGKTAETILQWKGNQTKFCNANTSVIEPEKKIQTATQEDLPF